MSTSTAAVPRSVRDWASEVTVAPTPGGRRTRDRGLAAAVVAGPLAMTGWFLVEPAVLPREDPAVFLSSVASSPGRYLLATALVALAGALGVPAALGIARLLRARLPRLAPVLGLLMGLSALGLWAQVGYRLVVASLVGPDVPASAVQTWATFQDSPLFSVLLVPAFALGALTTVLLVGALLRTGLVARWVPCALLAGTVLGSGEFPDPVTVTGAVVVAAGNTVLARALLARSS
jgi:hypothetical protein